METLGNTHWSCDHFTSNKNPALRLDEEEDSRQPRGATPWPSGKGAWSVRYGRSVTATIRLKCNGQLHRQFADGWTWIKPNSSTCNHGEPGRSREAHLNPFSSPTLHRSCSHHGAGGDETSAAGWENWVSTRWFKHQEPLTILRWATVDIARSSVADCPLATWSAPALLCLTPFLTLPGTRGRWKVDTLSRETKRISFPSSPLSC